MAKIILKRTEDRRLTQFVLLALTRALLRYPWSCLHPVHAECASRMSFLLPQFARFQLPRFEALAVSAAGQSRSTIGERIL